MAKTDLAAIEQQLAERAQSLREQISAPETRIITVSQKDGQLIGPGGLSLGDELRIIVIDFCTEKRYYDRPYDPQNTVPPACMAIGDVIKEMVPEDGVPAKQSDACQNCWANQWESDPRGKGKACKETRNLMVVLADELEDPDAEVEPYLVKCSPTSLKSYDAAALKAQQLFGSTPIKAIMTMKAVPSETYYNLRFGNIEANPYLERVFPLLEGAAEFMGRLPDFSGYEPPKHFPPGDARNARR